MRLEKPIIRMPTLVGEQWLGVERPLQKPDWWGRVVLIDFWEYSCINCQRTWPYLRIWQQRYGERGLLIIGVHTPEFAFGKLLAEVAAAAGRAGLSYPILLDEEGRNWDRFAVKAWPTKFLVDPAGYIRYKQQGEGGYQAFELGIQTLLRERGDTRLMPDLLGPQRPEDKSGAVCYRATPELYAGYERGLFGTAVGNPEGYVPNETVLYGLTTVGALEKHRFYLEGFWQVGAEGVVFKGREGRVLVSYEAAGVNMVASPAADMVALRLGLTGGVAAEVAGEGVSRRIEVKLDGEWLVPAVAGRDIVFDEEGRSWVELKRPGMVELVADDRFGAHLLELIWTTPEAILYTFSFTSCMKE
ncbi:MAG TPA: redoxin domain-containing protein [Anaerolineae bacterium]|nr:redoxin domain-containing protein [Anaerolineae bacterium]